MDVTPVTGMALEDWLLEGEAIRFSAYDSYSKEEIAVTDRRLIFYHSSLTREEINAYNLSHIAGYKIIAVRRIELTILGAIIAVISLMILHQILTFTIEIKPEILVFIPFSTLLLGVALIVIGLLSQQILELTIAGGKITKPLKLSEKQLKELSKAIQV